MLDRFGREIALTDKEKEMPNIWNETNTMEGEDGDLVRA